MAVTFVITLAILATGFVIAGKIVERRKLRQLSSPTCTGRAWRRAFPASSKQEIRQFHRIVLAAFGLDQRYHLRFAPDVKLMDLYRAVEPPVLRMGVDAMELEWFLCEIERCSGVDLSGCWNDHMTLADAFALAHGCSYS